MPTKKQMRNKKRRSVGGNPAEFTKTAVKGVEKASQNSSQQALTRKEPSKLFKDTQGEVGYGLWKGVLTGKPPNFSKVGTAVQKRVKGLKEATERGIKLVGHAGIPTAGIKSTMSSASTSLSGITQSASKSGSSLAKSATNSFSDLTGSATKGMGCIIL